MGTSKTKVTRDLQDLLEKEIFIPIGGGRSTRYEIKLYWKASETYVSRCKPNI